MSTSLVFVDVLVVVMGLMLVVVVEVLVVVMEWMVVVVGNVLSVDVALKVLLSWLASCSIFFTTKVWNYSQFFLLI